MYLIRKRVYNNRACGFEDVRLEQNILDAGNKNYKEDLSITYLNVSVKTYRAN